MIADFGGFGRKGKYITVNVTSDIRGDPDILCDVSSPELVQVIGQNTLDGIRTTHTVEHLPSGSAVGVFRMWRRLLKEHGVLQIKVPDLGAMAKDYAAGIIPFDVFASVAYVPGSRVKNQYEDHHWGWDKGTLEADLVRAGYMIDDPTPDFVGAGSWLLDFDDVLHTGLVGTYKVPDLSVAGVKRDPKTDTCVAIILHFDSGNGRGNSKTKTCVDSVYKYGMEYVDHIMVVNASHHISPEDKMISDYLDGLEGVRTSVLCLDKPTTLQEAFNKGIEATTEDVLYLITNDTHMTVNTFGPLWSELTDPSVGIVAPGTNDAGSGVLYVTNPGNWSSLEVDHVDNTMWAFRRDLVKRVGNLDGGSGKGSWWSNKDYCLRAKRAGYRVVAVRSAYIIHDHQGGQNLGEEEAGRKWFFQKWGFLI